MADILNELKDWLGQLVKDAPHRIGESPETEITILGQAIAEIERLRAAIDKGEYSEAPK